MKKLPIYIHIIESSLKGELCVKKKLLLFVLFVSAIFLAYKACAEHKPYYDAKIKHNALIEVATEDVKIDSDILERQIDFTTLQKINPEIIGWIFIPQLNIDEPILKGSDDVFYLTHDFEGNESPLGSVFTWSDADRLLAEQHVFLFGHNMISGQMFGQLSKFQNTEFLYANPYIYIYTPFDAKKLEVFDCYTCDAGDILYREEEVYDTQICSLITCDGYENTSFRLVVDCRMIKKISGYN